MQDPKISPGVIICAEQEKPWEMSPGPVTGVLLKEKGNRLLVATPLARFTCMREGAQTREDGDETLSLFAERMRTLLSSYDLILPNEVRAGQWMRYSLALGDVQVIIVSQRRGSQFTLAFELTPEHFERMGGNIMQLRQPGVVEVEVVPTELPGPYGVLLLTLSSENMEEVWVRKSVDSARNM